MQGGGFLGNRRTHLVRAVETRAFARDRLAETRGRLPGGRSQGDARRRGTLVERALDEDRQQTRRGGRLARAGAARDHAQALHGGDGGRHPRPVRLAVRRRARKQTVEASAQGGGSQRVGHSPPGQRRERVGDSLLIDEQTSQVEPTPLVQHQGRRSATRTRDERARLERGNPRLEGRPGRRALCL